MTWPSEVSMTLVQVTETEVCLGHFEWSSSEYPDVIWTVCVWKCGVADTKHHRSQLARQTCLRDDVDS